MGTKMGRRSGVTHATPEMDCSPPTPARWAASAHQLKQHEHPKGGAQEAQVRTQRRRRGTRTLRRAAGPRAHFRRKFSHGGSARVPSRLWPRRRLPAVGAGSQGSGSRSELSAHRVRLGAGAPGAAVRPRPVVSTAPLTLASPVAVSLRRFLSSSGCYPQVGK